MKPSSDQTSALPKLATRMVGAVLWFAGVALAIATERALLEQPASLAQQGDVRLSSAAQTPRQEATPADPHTGMQRVAGMLRVVGQPHDPDFDLHVAAPTLLRRVEMFQWREVDGTSEPPHYEQAWVDHPLDADRFKHPAGHANPGRFPMESRRFDAAQVRVSDFILAPALLHALPGSQPVAPDMQRLPSNLAASFTLYQGALITSASPAKPRVGDLRVSWQAVPLQVVTVFARVDGDRLVPAAEAHDKGFEIEAGAQLSAEQIATDQIAPRQGGADRRDSSMPAEAVASTRFVQVRRVSAVLLSALGVWLLGRRQRRYRNGILLALALGALPVAIVAGVLWLGHAGAISAGWFGVALLAALVASWRLRRHAGSS